MKLQINITDETTAEIDSRADAANRGIARSASVQESLDRYFYLLKEAKKMLKGKLTGNELALIADVCNGTMFQAWSIPHLYSNIEESIEDGLDKKWDVDGSALVATLEALSNEETFALVDAIELFWRSVSSSSAEHVEPCDMLEL